MDATTLGLRSVICVSELLFGGDIRQTITHVSALDKWFVEWDTLTNSGLLLSYHRYLESEDLEDEETQEELESAAEEAYAYLSAQASLLE
jgi:hypothetical protein